MPFTNSFMQPVVEPGGYWEVETSIGTEYVPADLVDLDFRVNVGDVFRLEDETSFADQVLDAVAPYVEGNAVNEATYREGWLARMSAPGYMDCTMWTGHATEQEARQYLEDTYGEDE